MAIKDYYVLDYIQSSGTQYIDTGVPENTIGGLEVAFARTGTLNYGRVFGASTATNSLELFIQNTDYTLYTLRGNSTTQNISGFNSATENIFKLYDGVMYLNGSSVGTYSTLATASINLWISRGADRYGNNKYRYFKIWNTSNELIRDFIPAMRKSDSVLGLYDKVNDTFYTNAGSGTFAYGSIVPQVYTSVSPSGSGTVTTTEESGTYTIQATANSGYAFTDWTLDGYTQLEYIESSGTQWIDTGVLGKYGLEIKCKVSPTTSYSSNNYHILGSASGTSTGRFYLSLYARDASSPYWFSYNTGGNWHTSGISATIGQEYVVDYIFNNGDQKLYIDDVLKVSSTRTNYTSNNYSIYLFANNSHGSIDGKSSHKLFYFQIYDGSTLVRDFIPVIRHSDAQIGLLDLVHMKFYGNSGTGVFGAGGIVSDNNITLEDNPLVKELQDDISLIANFELAGYQITTQVSPSGYGTTTGDGYYTEGTSVTLTATPNTHKQFVNWTLNGTQVSTSATYTFTMGSVAQTYVANFSDAPQYTIITKTNPSDLIMVYQSATSAYSGDSVTFRAREVDGYKFSNWSNGSTTNPLTLTITGNTTLIAYYTKVAEINESYLYRAYVKSKTSLNSLPIAFMNVKAFTIREDLLASCNSEIECYSLPSEVSNGDILCLYNPKGKVIYRGVITKISDKKIQCSQMQSFYKGTWYENNYTTATTIEGEYQYLLNQYANGYIYGSSYQDSLVHDELAPLRVVAGTSTTGNLETFEAKKTIDMEKYIYSLYESYGLILEFNIPYGAWTIGDTDGGSTTIKIPSYTAIKIGNNAECITDMSPTLEIEDDNRLIVFSSSGTYRKTYVATSTSGIFEEPSSQVGRFNVVNTEIVFSDDDLDDIVKAKLPDTMYNHKVTFNLLLNNKIHDFWSWKLGQEFQIYKHDPDTYDEYFLSVYTAYKMTKKENEDVSEVEITCGKVRTALTDKLKLGVVN